MLISHFTPLTKASCAKIKQYTEFDLTAIIFILLYTTAI